MHHRWGENQEGKVTRVCKVMAYHWAPRDPYLGLIKREVGVLYPDVGMWTQEMDDEYYDRAPVIESVPVKKTRKKRRTKKPK